MSSLVKRTFTNAFWLFLSEICAKGVMFVSTLYLARVLGTTGFGIFSIGMAAGTYIWSVVDMGVSSYGVREVAQHRSQANQLLSTLNSMRLFLAAICLSVLIVGAFITNISSETLLVLIAGGLYALFYALSPDWLLKGIERMEYLALASGVMAISFLAAVVFLIKDPEDAVAAVLYRSLSFLVGSVVALIAVSRAMKLRFVFSFSFQQWRLHARESFYFAVNLGINNIAPFIPVFCLGLWSSADDVGLFSAPQRVVVLIVNAAAVIPMASYPILSNLYVTDRQSFCRVHKSFERIMLYFGLPIGLIGMLLSREIMTGLYGHDYGPASPLLSVIIWLAPLMFVRTNYGRSLASAGFHRFNMLATGSGALTTILVCLFGIRHFGVVAASWSLVIGEMVTLLLMGLMFLSKVHPANPFDTYFFKLAGASIVIVFSLKLTKLPVFPSIILGILLYGAASLITGLVTVTDIKHVWKRIARRELPAET